ncbi:hypothetical protein AAFF_G00441490 [Aldrovandia affinis]|uniref:Uncharacterized protein n=1 Tax=Aldrovandia affinis TaxID=143900 RepID=A0AAD7S7B8_9TELE|nr:hypothetical protein AAFF_G00441490 [Aldrovandia affinis]
MSAAGLRLGRKCSGLLLSRMSMAALVPTPRVQPSPPRVQPSPAGSLCARTLGWGARPFSDAAGQGSSLLPYGALAEPNPRENTPSLEDLNGAPPLSPFDEIGDEEAVQILATPPLPPVSTSLRDYVDQSETLSMLVQLVDLFQLQQRGGAVGSMLLRLELQDVQERLLFLRDLGLQDSQLGPLLTRNPFILTESMHNLQGRVSYLRSKRFSSEAVSSMVSRAPYLLNFSIERLDNRLAFFQSHLGLSPHKTRDLVTREPEGVRSGAWLPPK